MAPLGADYAAERSAKNRFLLEAEVFSNQKVPVLENWKREGEISYWVECENLWTKSQKRRCPPPETIDCTGNSVFE